jgi:hypothetical protein
MGQFAKMQPVRLSAELGLRPGFPYNFATAINTFRTWRAALPNFVKCRQRRTSIKRDTARV